MLDLLSCANCWFNGLQMHTVGLSVGYCTEHRILLRKSDETTCRRHLRKDLMHGSALEQREKHRKTYRRDDGAQRLADAEHVDNGEYVERDSSHLKSDSVGAIVAEYGELGTKIESLSQLRVLPGYRAELAMLSLARAYTNRCCELGGRWTSGIHLLWWTRMKLAADPVPSLGAGDFRYQSSASLARQQELAQWRLMTLRLVFISDVGSLALAEGHRVSQVSNLADRAAEDTELPSVQKLKTWIKRYGIPLLDDAFPESSYRQLAIELRQEPERRRKSRAARSFLIRHFVTW
jgi:hypothetical protein